MNKKLTITLLAFLPIWLNAQCLDCDSKQPEIAVGVTLLSNMKFTVSGQTTQPLELNLRYKLSDKSTFRLGTPIVWKQNIPGEPDSYRYPTSIEQYVENMQNYDLYPQYSSFYRLTDYYYSLYGVSLGYDYDLPLANNFSAFIGCDLGYYNQKIISNYYILDIGSIDENRKYKNFILQKTERVDKNNIISAKPLLGLRFTYQKLTLEADLAYHIAYNFIEINGLHRFWYAEVNSYEDMKIYYRSQHYFSDTNTPNRIVYSFRLFYNF